VTARLIRQILQDGLARNSADVTGADVVPDNLIILTDNEHGGCCLSRTTNIWEEVVNAVCVGNVFFTIRQDGILSLTCLHSVLCFFLRLNCDGEDLCSLFFIPGIVIFQLAQLAHADKSVLRVKKY